jgi:hypothetical protein
MGFTLLQNTRWILVLVLVGQLYDFTWSANLSRPTSQDLFEILGVPEGTESLEELRRAHRLALAQFHPDRAQSEADRTYRELACRRINAAWEVLQDPRSRGQYLQTRKIPSQYPSLHEYLPLGASLEDSAFQDMWRAAESRAVREGRPRIAVYRWVWETLQPTATSYAPRAGQFDDWPIRARSWLMARLNTEWKSIQPSLSLPEQRAWIGRLEFHQACPSLSEVVKVHRSGVTTRE